MKIFDKPSPTSEAEIKKFESDHGFELPSSYREFLLKYNGGRLEDVTFTFRHGDTGEEGEILFLFGFDKEGILDLTDTFEFFQDRMPENVIPIGGDGGGNLICMAVKGENYGQLYYWLHYEEDDILDFRNMYVIPYNINSLLKKLAD